MIWRTSRRTIGLDRTLVMAILNVTPDSFSDGGRFASLDEAVKQTERLISEGADILDVGGESTRPGSARVSADEEVKRVVPVIEAVAKRFDVPVSIDTSKAEVARAAIDAGAEIVNDISGFIFDPLLASVCAETDAGAVLMHLRGSFESMHSQEPVTDVIAEVARGWRESLGIAASAGVESDRVALDIGIGFGKTLAQNLELIAKLDKLVDEFSRYPILVGASRKSFIGKILDGSPPDQRFGGSLAAATVAVWNGARIVRVHDVAETARAVRLTEALKQEL